MFSRRLIAVFLLAATVPVQSVSAAGGSDYEIPLSELKKVEKKKQKKAETRKRKKRKEADSASRETSHKVPTSTPLEPETPQHAAEVMETPDSAHISHEPYSYVVADRRTVIKAIISMEAVQSVRCRFRSLDKGGYASVAMPREPGSQFTYVATLPPLKPGAPALRYRFIVVGASGVQTYSQEFSMPVKQTSLMPGWQQEPGKEPVKAALENPFQPLEGFSDVVME